MAPIISGSHFWLDGVSSYSILFRIELLSLIRLQEAIRELGRGAEITRFKGLGEVDVKEFKDFIGPDMKLERVTLEDGESI